MNLLLAITPFRVNVLVSSDKISPIVSGSIETWDALNFLLQSRLEKFEQQVFFSLVGGVVVQGEDHDVHELSGLVLWHLEDELGQVVWVCLKVRKNKGRLRVDRTSMLRHPPINVPDS